MLTKFSHWITGDRQEVMKNQSSFSRKKRNVLASLILLPTIMWLINGYLITKVLMQESFFLSLIVGIVCAGFIFILDRSIVVIKGNNKIANMRIALGVAVSILGAVLVDSIILKKDVDFFMNSSFAAEAKSEKTKAEEVYDRRIIAQEENCKKSYATWQQIKDEYDCEINGTCGTKRVGVSKAALAKKELMEQAKAEYDKQFSILTLLKQQQKDAGIQAGALIINSTPTLALFARIDYMHRMIFHNWITFFVYALFFFIALMIELAVILVKRWSNKSAYELAEELLEKIQARKIQELDNFSLKQFEGQLGYGYRELSAQNALSRSVPKGILN